MHLKSRKYLQIRGLITKEGYDHSFVNVGKKLKKKKTKL